MKIALIVLSILVALVLVSWIGLQVKPKPFPEFAQSELKTVPLPDGLPAPVERFYRVQYGDQIPVIETVFISGRTVKPHTNHIYAKLGVKNRTQAVARARELELL